MESESEPIKLEHDVKTVVLGEDGANQSDDYYDLNLPSVSQQFKTHSHANSTTLMSAISNKKCEYNNLTSHLELEDNCVDKINHSVLANYKSSNINPNHILDYQQKYEKMKTKEELCRFCFKMCNNFKSVDCDIRDVLDLLLPEIDIDAVQKPVTCTLCAAILFESFDFKRRCFNTYAYLVAFVDKKNGVKLNLNDIYITKTGNNNIIVPEYESICGFCMCPAKNCSVIFLDGGQRDVTLKKALQQCLPELDLSIIKEPVICPSCHASLENHSRFVTSVLIVEEMIRKYREALKISSGNQIDLSSIFQFIREVDGDGDDTIKLEKEYCDHSENVEKEVEHKYNGKSSEIGASKIKETCCGRDGVEVKEENIKVEDQRTLHLEEIEIKTDDLDFNRFEAGSAMTPQKRTIYKGILQQHLLKHKAISEVTVYTCDLCGYETKYKNNLKIHVLKHKSPTKVRKYKCDSCAYQSIYKTTFERHLLKHRDISEVTMYKCDTCAFQTKYKNGLKIHLLTHMDISEVRMYKCDSCLYQTKYTSHLKRHSLALRH